MKANSDFEVLILEDEKFICSLLELALSDADANLHTAHDCKSAMELALAVKPDLALLDIGLPDGDGRDFARDLRKAYRDEPLPIPVIFLTGRLDQRSRVDAYLVDAIDYITKPFSIMEISMKLSNMIKLIKVKNQEFENQNSDLTKIRHKKNELHQAIIDLCQTNCSNPDFAIEQAASMLGVSTRTLQRRLSSNFDTSFSEILQSARMETAKIYLENDYSIKETSRACGYRHVENFSAAFTRANNVTPKEFKAEMNTTVVR